MGDVYTYEHEGVDRRAAGCKSLEFEGWRLSACAKNDVPPEPCCAMLACYDLQHCAVYSAVSLARSVSVPISVQSKRSLRFLPFNPSCAHSLCATHHPPKRSACPVKARKAMPLRAGGVGGLRQLGCGEAVCGPCEFCWQICAHVRL